MSTAEGREIARVAGIADEMRVNVRAVAPDFSMTFALPGDSMVKLDVRNRTAGTGEYPWVSRVFLAGQEFADVEHSGPEFSLCVTSDCTGTNVSAGDGTRIFDGKIDFRGIDTLSIHIDDKTELARPVDFEVRYKIVPEFCAFADMPALVNHLATSPDSIEGLWQWADCDTKVPAVTAGGRYTLATVTNCKGGYDIVYVDGARVGVWQPLQLKGSMTPTPFVNQFDVRWLDAEGEDAGEGIYATVTADGLLTLTFAPLHSALRLIRRPMARH